MSSNEMMDDGDGDEENDGDMGEEGNGVEGEEDCFHEIEIREQDRFLPIANIARIMKKVLPGNAKIAKDAKESLQECVSEFISFITSEASDKCQAEKRKTINGDDSLWAMNTLGFDKYVEPLKTYLSKYRESVKGEKPEKKLSVSARKERERNEMAAAQPKTAPPPAPQSQPMAQNPSHQSSIAPGPMVLPSPPIVGNVGGVVGNVAGGVVGGAVGGIPGALPTVSNIASFTPYNHTGGGLLGSNMGAGDTHQFLAQGKIEGLLPPLPRISSMSSSSMSSVDITGLKRPSGLLTHQSQMPTQPQPSQLVTQLPAPQLSTQPRPPSLPIPTTSSSTEPPIMSAIKTEPAIKTEHINGATG
mmetsp:Transcript_20355/g.19663  ORF Transcript_20355/g.19663 Transcript_20355/m.19663 type:complete len:359 (-) Transcript_20355:250-1326(-)|eukprot:CAMPEP_0119042120 /NCGR_PEP_ID=MMETSP1177-20130426/14370_1 /TAXON_ID=2985 /ORGANISM="Ochromonas sp, Strain CCMP1899" /LENGTH=358 /DNA_ID=CAMNT_0007008667 /DNA_START=150 /DNA_END=1226 /DNA_ORIENTATION=+